MQTQRQIMVVSTPAPAAVAVVRPAVIIAIVIVSGVP